MIPTERGYLSTCEALSELERALASMSRRKAEYGPNFALFAEPVVANILRLRAEIDSYTGLSDYLAAFGLPTDEAAPDTPSAATDASVADGATPAVH